MMMSVACLWYSSMENRYEAEENKHEHDEGIQAQFDFGNGFHAGIVAGHVKKIRKFITKNGFLTKKKLSAHF